ncbi:hypothetical protein KSS87_022658 [Heliosperma pusillum]|nr:hypothetical protein KSS87_022658 [Heliosperma pusillum]
MDGGDIAKFGGSLRRNNSSSVWRSNGEDVFSRSIRDEDDEEALRWAALEKLPTYDRLRKGILTTSHGVANEIDVNNLGFHDKKNLLERVGIEIPTIEVRYENLNVEAEVFMGSRALPTFINFITNMVEGVLNSFHLLSNRKKHLTILRDVSGIIRPKRMTLLLGPPSSGKTTLLLALAGKLDKDLQVQTASRQFNLQDYTTSAPPVYSGLAD